MKRTVATSYGFSIIEVLIGIFVFSLGLVSIYALIASSLSVGSYNKNAIVASNLAREQIELFMNTRDTNYKKLQIWNKQDPYTSFTPSSLKFESGKYYSLSSIEASQDIEVIELGNSIIENDASQLMAMRAINGYRLCIKNNFYTPCTGVSGEEETLFYKYLYLSSDDAQGNPLSSNPDSDKVRLVSKVIWIQGTYHEYEISTIVTDWRRI